MENRVIWRDKPYHFVKTADAQWDDSTRPTWQLKFDVFGSFLIDKDGSGFTIWPNKGEPKRVFCPGGKMSHNPVSNVFCCSDGRVGVLRVNGSCSLFSVNGEPIDTVFQGCDDHVVCSCSFPDGVMCVFSRGEVMIWNRDCTTMQWGKESREVLKYARSVVDVACAGEISLLLTRTAVVKLDWLGNMSKDREIVHGDFSDGHLVIEPTGKMVAVVKYELLTLISVNEGRFVQYTAGGVIRSAAFVDDATVAFVVENRLMFMGMDGNAEEVRRDVVLVVQHAKSVCIFTKDSLMLVEPVHKAVVDLESIPEVERMIKDKEGYDTETVIFGEKEDMDILVEKIIIAVPHVYDEDVLMRLVTTAAFGKRPTERAILHQVFAECIKGMCCLKGLRQKWGWCLTGTMFLTMFGIEETGRIDDILKLAETQRIETVVANMIASDKLDVASFVCNCFHFYSRPVVEALAIREIRKRNIPTSDIMKKLAAYDDIDYAKIAAEVLDCKGEEQAFAVIRSDRDVKRAMTFTLQHMFSQQSKIPDLLEKALSGNAMVSYIAYRRMKDSSFTGRQSGVMLTQYAIYACFIGNLWQVIRKLPKIPEQVAREIDFRRELIRVDAKNGMGMLNRMLVHERSYKDCLSKGVRYIDATNPKGCLYEMLPPRKAMQKALEANNEKLFNAIADAYGVSTATRSYIRAQAGYISTK